MQKGGGMPMAPGGKGAGMMMPGMGAMSPNMAMMMRPPMQQGGMPGGPGMRPPMPQPPQPAAAPPPGPNINAAALAAAPPAVQKQMIGEKLFPAIAKYQPEAAGKVTGMMLEMDNSELLMLLESEQQLKAKIDE